MSADNLTKRKIAEMLKENTGRHMLDSGGAYGRHWEENQTRSFDTESPITLEITKYGIEYTRNIYHFLVENLEYNARLTNNFVSFATKKCDKYDSWFECLIKWFDLKIELGVIVSTGIYGEGGKPKTGQDIFVENIYNGENNISQVFQYYEFQTDSGEDCIALMIHGGCDVRGGYTAPKIFNLLDESFYMVADGYFGCENGHAWYTDDNYNWYGSNDEPDLKDCQFIDNDDLTDNQEYQDKLKNQIIIPDGQGSLIEGYNPKIINSVYPLYLDGKLTVVCLDDKIGLCPMCGKPLKA